MSMQEARAILTDVAATLKAASIASAQQDARLLLAEVLDRTNAVLPHETIFFGDPEKARLQTLVARRVAREPISRIRGWREFWSLRFNLSSATLDPRPDSELIVETAISIGQVRKDADPERQLYLLDIGTGSGCLLLACLHELTHAQGIGLDISDEALAAASENAKALGLGNRSQFYHHDFMHNFMTDMSRFGSFDIILCNPPYIPQADIVSLEPEVAKHDPVCALDGGKDGLMCWRGIMQQVAASLAADGCLIVEIGTGQENDVTSLAEKAGMCRIGAHKDLAGIMRCLVFSLKN